MLKLVEGSYASLFPQEMDAMFRIRAEIFGERLGWEVAVKDGYERDRFDDLKRREHLGLAAAPADDRPNMLRDVFPREVVGRARRSGRARTSAWSRRPGSRSGRPPSHKRLNPTEHMTAGPNASRHLRRTCPIGQFDCTARLVEQLFRPDGGR